jgi:hypothetical protein
MCYGPRLALVRMNQSAVPATFSALANEYTFIKEPH